MEELLGNAALRLGADSSRFPWMRFALQKFQTQQPLKQTGNSDAFHFLNTVKDVSQPEKQHVQHWTDGHCTDWCSGFVNWCLTLAGHRGTNNALAASWLGWGQRSEPVWGAIAIVHMLNPKYKDHPYHVGFFIVQKPTQVYILGGNQRDKYTGMYSVNIRAFIGTKVRVECRMPKALN